MVAANPYKKYQKFNNFGPERDFAGHVLYCQRLHGPRHGIRACTRSRTVQPATIAGMSVGLLFTATYIVRCRADLILPFVDQPLFGPFLGISPEGIGTIGCILNFVVTLVVSQLTPPPPAHIQEFVENVRVPSSL
jgi:hypothetical protein